MAHPGPDFRSPSIDGEKDFSVTITVNAKHILKVVEAFLHSDEFALQEAGREIAENVGIAPIDIIKAKKCTTKKTLKTATK